MQLYLFACLMLKTARFPFKLLRDDNSFSLTKAALEKAQNHGGEEIYLELTGLV